MTLIKSSIPLTVYHAESPLLANITGDAIRRFAFRSIDNVPEEKQVDSSIVMTCSIRNGSTPYRKKGIIWLLASGWT